MGKSLRLWKVIEGDCVEVMEQMDEHSIDAIVTDPPYGLKFMGKDWDDMGHGSEQQAWHYRWAVEALRVLKPGGYLLAFGGTRTYHRLTSALEDAGFEIRDQMQWLYGTGFPKSHNISKAIDKAAGAERKVIGKRTDGRYAHGFSDSANRPMGSAVTSGRTDTEVGFQAGKGIITEPATPEAAQWEGWGTALKPAHEPIVVARQPINGTVAENVLEWGTGGLNIDATRVEVTDAFSAEGRWPANVILDGEAGKILDKQSGNAGSVVSFRQQPNVDGKNRTGGADGPSVDLTGEKNAPSSYGDKGGASRFFYCPKASKSEREIGLTPVDDAKRANTHPTVKPIALMKYLIRLVTPPNGLVLDPFAGSGTTGIAAIFERFRFVGIELEPEYVELSKARIKNAMKERQAGK